MPWYFANVFPSHHTPLLLLLHFLQHLQHSMLGGKPDSVPALAVLLVARAWQELVRDTGFRLVNARPPGCKVVLSDVWDLSVPFFILIVFLVPLSSRGGVLTPADDVGRRRFGLIGLNSSHLRTEGRSVSRTRAGMQGDEG